MDCNVKTGDLIHSTGGNISAPKYPLCFCYNTLYIIYRMFMGHYFILPDCHFLEKMVIYQL
jgi:hypothetical protein